MYAAVESSQDRSIQPGTLESWPDVLRPLRGRYVRTTLASIDVFDQLLARLATDPTDAVALDQVMRRFHALAGSGETYGFPVLSEIGAEGEVECCALVAEGAVPDAGRLARWRAYRDRLQQELNIAMAALEGGTALAATGTGASGEAGEPSTVEVVAAAAEEEPAATDPEAQTMSSARQAAAPAVQAPRDESLLELEAASLRAAQRAIVAFPAPAVPEPATAVHQEVACARILSMEDDPLQAASIRAFLEGAGYEVRSCSDPGTFASEVASFRPDLVLMDILLPGINGYELVRSLRQNRESASLPVLFLTTEGQMGARLESAWAGGDDHLVKPVTASLLLATVASRLERNRCVTMLAEYDQLTRLLTRETLLERARAAVEQRRLDPRMRAALALIDVDHLRSLNHRHGTGAGDLVLSSAATLLRRRLRHGEVIGRYGDDELGVLLYGQRRREVMDLLESLRQEFASGEMRSPGKGILRATFSVGIAALEAGQDADLWFKAAERALLAAKRAGRNQACIAA